MKAGIWKGNNLMKYGESSFDILYLLLAIICGIIMLIRARDGAGKKMGMATLILGSGDAFHLVPRVILFRKRSHNNAGHRQTCYVRYYDSFLRNYVLYIWQDLNSKRAYKKLTAAVWVLFGLRIILCLFPQNGWLQNESPLSWAIIRNIPFTALGIIIVALFYNIRDREKCLRFVWLYVTLSFLFYIPVAVGAGLVPILGMLMLPKTICYILLIISFFRYVAKKSA